MSDQPSKTGLIASSALHGGLLAALLFGFAAAPKFDDATESIPVATVTQSQFNEIMKGERDATPMKEPPPEPVHKAAAPPAPPTPPTPPPELKTADETPPPPIQPPPPPVQPPAPPVQAPPPPPRPEEPKAAPPPKPLAQDAPLPPSAPSRSLAPDAPAPPLRPKTPPPDKPKPDPLAKLLEKPKPDEAKPQKAYDPSAIAKLIGENKSSEPSANAPTPLGLPTQHAARMSPSLAAGLDAWLTEAYLNCWTPPPTMPDGERYVAEVRVAFNADGTLAAQPTLVNPPTDPAWRAHAESAVRAVLKCNPLRVPQQYAPYFEQWRTKTVHFDPQSALG